MKLFAAAAVLGVSLLFVGQVQAAPLAPVAISMSSSVIAVKDGCGIGFQRLSNGVCRPQPEGPRLMRLFARKCPLGYRRNLLGKCRKE